MIELSPDTVIIRKPAYASRVQDDLVLFDEESGKYFASSSVGADIWDLIETPRSVREISARLLESYDVAEDTCLAEVTRFASKLVDAGLAEKR